MKTMPYITFNTTTSSADGVLRLL